MDPAWLNNDKEDIMNAKQQTLPGMTGFDPLSMARIHRHSTIAMHLLERPAILMVGPPTRKQMDRQVLLKNQMYSAQARGNQAEANRFKALINGDLQNNFRLHVLIKDQWHNFGGHCGPKGAFDFWNNWAPAVGRWNNTNIKPETRQKIEEAIRRAHQEAISPMFVKLEREATEFQELTAWAITQGGEKE